MRKDSKHIDCYTLVFMANILIHICRSLCDYKQNLIDKCAAITIVNSWSNFFQKFMKFTYMYYIGCINKVDHFETALNLAKRLLKFFINIHCLGTYGVE